MTIGYARIRISSTVSLHLNLWEKLVGKPHSLHNYKAGEPKMNQESEQALKRLESHVSGRGIDPLPDIVIIIKDIDGRLTFLEDLEARVEKIEHPMYVYDSETSTIKKIPECSADCIANIEKRVQQLEHEYLTNKT